MYGVTNELVEKIKDIKEKYNLNMCIFGSRARGDYRDNSDIDIAILNTITEENIRYKIMDEFDKIISQYKIDLVFVQNVKNEKFLNSIKREGKEI